MPAEIDASCRLPLFALFGGGALWLVLSSVLGLIASIKFHGPQFLSNWAWLSYGRVFPAWSNLLVYGFCIPTGMGIGLWMVARLGRVRLWQPALIAAGAKLWHLGVLAGLIGILSGGSTGFEWLEFPHYAVALCFTSFAIMAVCGIITLYQRRERGLYPSQWFVVASWFWFPWIYSTAALLLLAHPVRGVVQASIDWWFSGNLLVVWLGLTGVAAIFYLLPSFTGQPLKSRYTALFAFWTLILFGSWIGIPGCAALPAWMPVISGAAAVLAIVPALAVGTAAVQTAAGFKGRWSGGPISYASFGALSFLISGLLLAASGVPQSARVTDFTWFGAGEKAWRLYGFFAMTMFCGVYHVLPRVAGTEFPFAKLKPVHFWCGALGTALLGASLTFGGIAQGLGLLNAKLSFLEVEKSTLPFLRASTLGDLLIAVGNALFLLNVGALILRYYWAMLRRFRAVAMADLQSAEVGQ